MNTIPAAAPEADASPPAAPGPLALSAGPLTLFYETGWIRAIRLGGAEIVRRVYGAVRDEFWNTIPCAIDDLVVQQNASSFLITYNCRHRRKEIDFLWKAEISGKESGEISFAMRGIALSRFRRNRIGLCVLHPLSTCKGRPCRVETVDAITEERLFPVTIAPSQPFLNIRALSYPIASGLDATLRFEGEVFESEDQRNWTDASYKTYSTPLSLPFPVTIEKGTLVSQKVTINIDKPSAPLLFVPLAPQIDLSGPAQQKTLLPAVGAQGECLETASAETLRRVRSLGLTYARIDCHFSTAARESLLRAKKISQRLDRPVELALHFASDPQNEAENLVAWLKQDPFPVIRFIVYRQGERSVTHETVNAVLPALRSIQPGAPVAGGTDGHFVELNRHHPPSDLLDAISFSATPQVHTFDNTAIMENLPGLYETLHAATLFSQGKPAGISPLTLRPRKNAAIPEKDGGPDPRQDTVFAAAWLAGALSWCAQGNAAFLTLGNAVGQDGLLSAGGAPHPLSLLLRRIAPFVNVPAIIRAGSDPARTTAIEWRQRTERFVVIVNCSGEKEKILVRGVGDTCRLSGLDEKSWKSVRTADEMAGTLPEEPIAPKNGTVHLELDPYALGFLTCD